MKQLGASPGAAAVMPEGVGRGGVIPFLESSSRIKKLI